jgi:hypothetical protein
LEKKSEAFSAQGGQSRGERRGRIHLTRDRVAIFFQANNTSFSKINLSTAIPQAWVCQIVHTYKLVLTSIQQITDMEVVTPPQLTARKAGQMAAVLLQEMAVALKQEVKILLVAQRYATWYL